VPERWVVIRTLLHWHTVDEGPGVRGVLLPGTFLLEKYKDTIPLWGNYSNVLGSFAPATVASRKQYICGNPWKYDNGRYLEIRGNTRKHLELRYLEIPGNPWKYLEIPENHGNPGKFMVSKKRGMNGNGFTIKMVKVRLASATGS